ncbi:MAG: hypothetical protein AAF697_13075 [Pseudomonadota bacterium]
MRSPYIEALLGGIPIDGFDIEELRRFCKNLTEERSAWDIGHRSSGLFHPDRIKKADADSALRRALRSLKGGEQ